MQQSNAIFGAVFIAYIVFITIRGELASYVTLLKGGGTPATAGSSGGSANPLGSALQEGENLVNGNSSILDTSSLDSFNTQLQDANPFQGTGNPIIDIFDPQG